MSIVIANSVGCLCVTAPTKISLNGSIRSSMILLSHDRFTSYNGEGHCWCWCGDSHVIEICKNLYIQVLLFYFVSSAITIDSRIGEHKKWARAIFETARAGFARPSVIHPFLDHSTTIFPFILVGCEHVTQDCTAWTYNPTYEDWLRHALVPFSTMGKSGLWCRNGQRLVPIWRVPTECRCDTSGKPAAIETHRSQTHTDPSSTEKQLFNAFLSLSSLFYVVLRDRQNIVLVSHAWFYQRRNL